MTMKKKLAIVLCSMPFAMAPIAYAQTGGATEGTTSPQSGSQTDMGTDGAPNTGGASGSGSSDTGTSPSPATSGAAASGAAAGSAATTDASAGESFQAKMKGKSVYNENDEKIGDVKDLVLSSDGKATHVIIGVGGFVGVGEHPVAIPFDEVKHSGDKLTLQGYTKDQLKEMPAYEYPREAPAPAPAPAAPMGTR